MTYLAIKLRLRLHWSDPDSGTFFNLGREECQLWLFSLLSNLRTVGIPRQFLVDDVLTQGIHALMPCASAYNVH